MKIILIVAAVVFFVLGNRLMNDYSDDWYSTLGIVLMFLGMVLGIVGLMMTPPM